jgi:hypothetical protein
VPTALTRFRRTLVVLAAATLLIAIAVPVGAAGPPGNNGTVKIHSGVSEDDSLDPPVINNEPHVTCAFHAHFFFADSGQVGDPTGPDWWIVSHPPSSGGTGASGDYVTNGNGEYATGPILLDQDGHYKLYWVGRDGKNIKHKVFWATGCGEGEGDPEG